MKEILNENKYLLLLWVFCIAGLIIFCGHYSNILIDFGREVYYPEQILEGKVLYKDLFNIYGPLSYQINAVLYKIFGAKLSTLYGNLYNCSKIFEQILEFLYRIFYNIGLCCYHLYFQLSFSVFLGCTLRVNFIFVFSLFSFKIQR